MNEAAFLLGQLLAGADLLHRGYCEDQRDGSIPPSLLGNQILAVAQRSPSAAVSQLTGRWRVYAGWAEKRRGEVFPPGKDGPPRAWAIFNATRIGARLAPVARELHTQLPATADDVFCAELLLGYIAGPPKWPSPKPGASPDGAPAAEPEED